MTNPTTTTAKILRKRYGAYLKACRLAAGLNQRQLADLLRMVYEQGIAHPEQGRVVPPVTDLHLWAEAVNVTPKEFAKQYLRYIEPEVFEMLYGEDVYAAEQLPRPERIRKTIPTGAARPTPPHPPDPDKKSTP